MWSEDKVMEKIVLVVCLLIAVACYGISAMHFMQKGKLFNNAYLYASKEEREKMNKKPYYRQSAIVFLGLGTIFLFNAIQALVEKDWPFQMVIGLSICTLVYAVISSYFIEKKKKQEAKKAEEMRKKSKQLKKGKKR